MFARIKHFLGTVFLFYSLYTFGRSVNSYLSLLVERFRKHPGRP